MTRSRSSRPARKSRAKQKEIGRHASGGFLFATVAIIVMLLGVHVWKIWLEHRTDALGQEWERKNQQMAQLRDQQENLRLQKESLTDGDYILARAQEMGLSAPQPGQVRRLYRSDDSLARREADVDAIRAQIVPLDD